MLLTTTTTIAWLLAIAAVPLVAGDATNNVNTTHKPYIPEGSGFPLRVSGSESLSALTIGDDGRVVVPQAKEEVLQRLLPVARTPCELARTFLLLLLLLFRCNFDVYS